jgi:Do/DeqQ family serine protease
MAARAQEVRREGQAVLARQAPTDAAIVRLSFAPVVKRAAPAVVNVYSRRVVRQQFDPFWSLFAGGAPRERIEQSLGSGSIVRSDGVILTNHHVIAEAQDIQVVTADRREWRARVLLDDPRADLAVLKIEAKGETLPTLEIDATGRPEVGDLVLAIGDPFGVGQTVTNGIVSALARSEDSSEGGSVYLQTDAPINPGNSGGPLVDMAGRLIGVNTAIVSSSGASAGVGFAIPAALAARVVEAALGGAHALTRPWIGLRAQSLDSEMARSLGLAAPRGVLAADLRQGGPAAEAGVKVGDVIETLDSEPVNDAADFNFRIGARRAGETILLGVRDKTGAQRRIRVVAAAPPMIPAADPRVLTGRNPLSGAELVNLSPALAVELGLDPVSAHGVLIRRIGPGFAQSAGFRPGDFVRRINGQTIETSAGAAAALAAPAGEWTVTIEREGRSLTATFDR